MQDVRRPRVERSRVMLTPMPTSEALPDAEAGQSGHSLEHSEEPERTREHREALERARGHLLSLQHDEGWWKGELQTNVTMDAEDLLLRQFLGIRDPEATERSARWIRSQQRADGSWANFWRGPGDLSTRIEADVAVCLAGGAPG